MNIFNNTILFFKRTKANKLDITVKNLLLFLLNNDYVNSSEIYSDYPLKKRYEAIYNCALNTIDEFIHHHPEIRSTLISTIQITDLFKENFFIRQFERNNISVEIPENTQKIINEFKCLKEYIDENKKNEIIQNVNHIITGTI